MGVSSKEGKRARGKREQGIKLKRIRSCERKTFIAFSPFPLSLLNHFSTSFAAVELTTEAFFNEMM